MIAQGRITHRDLPEITQEMQTIFNRLMSISRSSDQWQTWLEETRSFLRRLLQLSFDQEIAKSRIYNVERYLKSKEIGAARYEAELMLSGLCLQGETTDSQFSSSLNHCS